MLGLSVGMLNGNTDGCDERGLLTPIRTSYCPALVGVCDEQARGDILGAVLGLSVGMLNGNTDGCDERGLLTSIRASYCPALVRVCDG